MKITTNSQRGFTLVEIMIVVAIIGLLAAIAVPNFVRARETAQLNSILNNLRLIEGAKDQWALENRKTTGAAVGSTSLAVYLRNNEWVQKLANETYNINAIGTQANATGFSLTGKTHAFADGTTN
jgi:prepilin-type N-terminal cleavage/methylation domain-containing protein